MTRLAELSEESKKCLEDPDSRCVFISLSWLNFCKPVLVMFLYLSYVDHADDLYLTVSGPALKQPLQVFQCKSSVRLKRQILLSSIWNSCRYSFGWSHGKEMLKSGQPGSDCIERVPVVVLKVMPFC